METDTIAALATPFGEGAVAILRISGPDAFPITAKLTGRPVDTWPPRQLIRTPLLHHDQPIDDALGVRFIAPASYTGEHLAELHLHGGSLLAKIALESAFRHGARPAGPGEFTQRAFLNGKLDLTQAEAVMDLIQARSTAALHAAHRQLSGGLGTQITSLRDQLLEALAHLEAYIDFPEEDIDPETGDLLHSRLASIETICRELLATSDDGRILREGARIVIAGKPNVGKSSLLNTLLGEERAIVTDQPGTTRDSIEETVSFHGIPVRFIDTAGLRESSDPVEQMGIARSRDQLHRADLILWLQSADHPPEPIPDDPRHLLVVNKADLPPHPDWNASSAIRISCTHHTGFDTLRHAIHDRIVATHTSLAHPTIAINARHQVSLETAATRIHAGIDGLQQSLPPEFISIELRDALDALGEIVGKIDSEQLLDRIFANFCIGK